MSQGFVFENNANNDSERRNTNSFQSEGHDSRRPDRNCRKRHKHRVANATLELAIDVETEFELER
ncbi:MAG: hypothetical protein FWB98_02025 [Defluviitaleaceae bacterium]|nr:hypothetical protein [Defluviitaleaceae bacterium]